MPVVPLRQTLGHSDRQQCGAASGSSDTAEETQGLQVRAGRRLAWSRPAKEAETVE